MWDLPVSELGPIDYYPESLSLVDGLDFSLWRVNPDDGRLIIPAAAVERATSDAPNLKTEQIDRAYQIYSRLYPNVSRDSFNQRLKLYRVAFLIPYTQDPDDICITFSVLQNSRLNGIAQNLVYTSDYDPEVLIVINREGRTNILLGVGKGSHKGIFIYDVPDVVMTGEGKDIVTANRSRQIPEARILVIPGRHGVGPSEAIPFLPGVDSGGWESISNRRTSTTTLDELKPVQLKQDEISSTPLMVIARWGIIQAPASVLSIEQKRKMLSDKLWR